MIVGVTGTTTGGTILQQWELTRALRSDSITELHHGDAIGVDAHAHLTYLMAGRNPRIIGHPPDNPRKRAFCQGFAEIREPKPYLVRDQEMVNEIEMLFAAPDTPEEIIRSGTWATVRYARKRRLLIAIIQPDGIIRFD